MKKIIFSSLICLFLISSCDKDDSVDPPAPFSCTDLLQHSSWEVEDFKTDYSIQFPASYNGGMTTFEGNFFDKVKQDSSVHFYYNFCGPLFCEDFGEEIEGLSPDEYTVSIGGTMHTLDRKQSFCQNNMIVGVFYSGNISGTQHHGRYFMLTDGQFAEGLSVDFEENQRAEMTIILQTIAER